MNILIYPLKIMIKMTRIVISILIIRVHIYPDYIY